MMSTQRSAGSEGLARSIARFRRKGTLVDARRVTFSDAERAEVERLDKRWFWAMLVIGGAIAFAWPYVVSGYADPLAEGIFRAGAWATAIGAVYLLGVWGAREGGTK
jgi:hypothetical protein